MTRDAAQVTLPSDTELQVTRRFKAPRALVYRAYTEPALIRRWMLGPPGWTMPVCEMDVRVGGEYRWRWRSEENGAEFGFPGEFREIEPGVRIVHTESFDPGTSTDGAAGGPPALVTLTLSEDPAGTLATTLVDFHTREARDAAMATGMTDGMEHGHQRLDGLFASGEMQ